MSAEALELDHGEEHRLAALRRFELLDTPPEPEFDRIVRLAAQVTECPMAVLALIDLERVWFKANLGFAYAETARAYSFEQAVAADNAFQLAVDTLADPRFMRLGLVHDGPRIRFYAGAPLRSPDGHAIGALGVLDRRPRPEFGPADVQALEDLAAVAADLMLLRDANRRLAELATIDELTGVLNRRRFLDLAEAEMVRSARYGTPASLALIDLDHFKAVNDQYGNAAGDAALRHAATMFSLAARKPDLLGRIGGEEFAVLMPHTLALEGARGAERLRDRLARSPLEIGRLHVPLTASIGVAQSTGAASVEAWIDRADRALYAAKDGGRNRVVVNPVVD